METTVQIPRTVIDQYAAVLMDLRMAHQELLALEKSQQTSLTIKLMLKPEDHTKPPVIPPQHHPRPPQLTHGPLPRLSSKPRKPRRRMIKKMRRMKFPQTKLRRFQFFRLSPEECTPPTLEENE